MIPVQAAIGKIVARESIKGFKKDVLTKIQVGALQIEKGNFREQKKEKQDQNNLQS